jgi:iron complex transport system substrate-binding protein
MKGAERTFSEKSDVNEVTNKGGRMKKQRQQIMAKISTIVLACITVLGALGGCQPTSGGGQGSGAGNGSESDFKINYAEKFSIRYMADDIKLVTDSDGRELLLVPKETAVPSGYDNAILIRTPISHAFYGSTTHVGLLGALDKDSLYDSISAVATAESSWTTPQILERFASGQIVYMPTSNYGLAEAEAVLDLNPDVYFTVAAPDLGRQTQYEEVGITYVAVGEWLEKSNQAYLEWIKFFGAFYNEDELAASVFEAKLARMDEVRAMVTDIPDSERPVVVYAQVWSGIVYTQATNSTSAKEIQNAGGVYYLSDLIGEGSQQISMEEFFANARDADVIVWTGLLSYTPDKAALLEIDPLFAECLAFQNDRVYIFASDYYMNSAAVDVKFEDMVTIFHPELMPDHELRLIIRLPD